MSDSLTALSKKLLRYATLIKLEGRSKYFHKKLLQAADLLASYHGTREDLLACEDLEVVFPKLGKSVHCAIRELLETGKPLDFDYMQNKHDSLLCDIAEIPGIGCVSAHKIYASLGVQSMDELCGAIQDGRIDDVAGCGPLKLQSLREFADEYQARHALSTDVQVEASAEALSQNEIVDKLLFFCPKCYQSAVIYPIQRDEPCVCSACSQRYPYTGSILQLKGEGRKVSVLDKQSQRLNPSFMRLVYRLSPSCLLEEILLRLPPISHNFGSPTRLLCFGASLPKLSQKILQNIPNSQIFAINENEFALQNLNAVLGKHAQIHLISAYNERLPFENAIFDYVIWDPLYLPTDFSTKLISELLRVLKPSSTLILTGLRLPSKTPELLKRSLAKIPAFAVSSPQLEELLKDYEMLIQDRTVCGYIEIIAVQKSSEG
ncbi:MAG: hypothetical protein ACOX8U_02530 [Bradymonadia bacterium]